MDDENYKYRIDKTSLSLMLAVAGFFDLIQLGLTFIPFLGWIISSLIAVLAFLTFYLWFKIKNVGFMTKFGVKKIAAYLVVPLVDAVLSFVPGLTIMVLLTYSFVKAEDEADRLGIMSHETQEELGEMFS